MFIDRRYNLSPVATTPAMKKSAITIYLRISPPIFVRILNDFISLLGSRAKLIREKNLTLKSYVRLPLNSQYFAPPLSP